MTLALAALIALIALSSAACGSPIQKPDIKQNPHPERRYEVTLKIEGAPGPIDAVTGSLDFQVSNDRCVPLSPGSGATVVPQEHLPLTLTRVSDSVYEGSFYSDLLLDGDYYSLGVCHWEFVAVGAELKAGKVDFSPSLFNKDLLAGHAVTTYFSRDLYAKSHEATIGGLTDAGSLRREDFKDPAATFSVTITAKEHGL